jgi:hypothetical protein
MATANANPVRHHAAELFDQLHNEHATVTYDGGLHNLQLLFTRLYREQLRDQDVTALASCTSDMERGQKWRDEAMRVLEEIAVDDLNAILDDMALQRAASNRYPETIEG